MPNGSPANWRRSAKWPRATCWAKRNAVSALLVPRSADKNVVTDRPHGLPTCRRSAIAVLGLLATGAVNWAQAPAARLGSLRVLTTAREAHSLSTTESRRGYPVHLVAVVTYYDPYIDPRHVAMFVADVTAGIFVSLPKTAIPELHAGTLVDITGVTVAGDFAPMVEGYGVRVIEKSHLPATAPRVSFGRLLTGADDGQWVEIEGLVHSAVTKGKNVTLYVAMSDGTIGATTVEEEGRDYSGLIDATVRMRGSIAPF